ncbi:unnamed protein product [Absidia cylindrospora]
MDDVYLSSGNIYCHDCSSRKVPLPQLGYGNRPVRVCNDCFEVAYLVTYAIDEDHGLSTQIHGARGLLELTEKEEDKDLHNMVAHGGIDALIWLCRTSTNTEIHHLVTTNLAMLAEKESIRPVIITKWALPPLLQLLRHYIHDQQNINGINGKKPPTASIASASPSSTGTHSSSTETVTKQLTIEDIDHYTVYLEIIINCTHVIYQLAKAGILSQEEIITDGVLETLFSLTMYKMDNPVDRTTSDDSSPLTEKQHEQNMKGIGPDYQEQWKERESVIQGLAAKSISFISSTVSNQASVIEQLRNSNKLTLAVTSENDEVKKYIAKTVAYLSLRNDKYKPVLLGNGKVRSLLSVLVLLPQTDPNFDDSTDLRQSDIAYYLPSGDGGEEDSRRVVSSVHVSKSDQAPYTAAVSHICCALANFATNQESQVILMAQPRLLQYVCNIPSLFPSHLETHRHVARCLANLALYDENKDKMLATTSIPNMKLEGKQQEEQNDSYNVIPTLLAMGQSANATKDLRRHIIRAVDNLSALNEDKESKKTQFWKSNYQNIKPLIEGIMALTDEEDTLKRAKSILERFQQHFLPDDDNSGKNVDDDDASDSGKQHTNGNNANDHDSNTNTNTNTNDQDEAQQDDSTETEHQENGPPKGKASKKNKKKKKNA